MGQAFDWLASSGVNAAYPSNYRQIVSFYGSSVGNGVVVDGGKKWEEVALSPIHA